MTADTVVHQDRGMITRQELADLLHTVDAKDLADTAQVSIKTIYRLRKQVNVPSLEMVERLLAAIKQLRRK